MNRRILLFCLLILITPSLFAFQSRKKVEEVDDAALQRQRELLAQYEKVEADAKAEEERRLEAERLAKLEEERKAAEALELERQRLEKERLEQERLEKERLEQERLEKERLEKERQEAEAQAALEKQIEHALEKEKQKTVTAKKQKEYLSEYLIQDDFETEEIIEQEEVLPEPDEKDSFGRTALMLAAKQGDDNQIKLLLKSKADVNLTDSEGWTALMYAVRYSEKTECTSLLINAGADIKKKNKYGQTALSIASSYNNNPKILSVLLNKYRSSDTDLLRSFVFLLSEQNISEELQLAKIKIFLDTGLPLNVLYDGKTPLMYAAAYGNSTKAIKLLIDNDASVSVRNPDGKTAFDYAQKNYNLAHDETYWALNIK